MGEQQEVQRFHSTHNESFWISLGKLLRVDTIVSRFCQFVSPGDQRFHSTHNEPFWTSLGKLLQVDTIVSPRLLCQFVSPGDQPKKNEQETKDYNMIVEIIMNKNDRVRVLNSLGFGFDHAPEDPNDLVNYVKTTLSCYLEEIKPYGFNHIIILTECYYGMLFLDCYGRIFEIDCMCDVLRLYGDYFERIEIAKKNRYKYLATWVVEVDGTVVDYEIPYDDDLRR